MTLAKKIEFRPPNIGDKDVTLSVTGVDNELTILLNGEEVAQLTGPGGFSPLNANLSSKILRGQANVLVISLVNYNTGGNNPWSCNGVLNVGDQVINLDAQGNDVPDGLRVQYVVVIQR